MDNNIFRKKSLDQISSPEDLNSYLRVTKPSVWIVICTIIAILAGAVIWGSVGKIETTVPGVIISGDETLCYISESDVSACAGGSVIHTESGDMKIVAVDDNSAPAQEVLSDYAMTLGGFERGEYVYAASVDCRMAAGNYECKIVTESISPISFLLNSAE